MNTSPAALLQELKEVLKPKLTEVTYDTWFKHLEAVTVENEKMLICESATPLADEIIESRYHDLIEQSLRDLGYSLSFKVYRTGTYTPQEKKALEKELTQTELAKKANLNARYTFSNFVSGNSNNLAYAAAVAVAEMPGVTYNPLYIWGNPGLGKTHLMQAIGHHVLEIDPTKKVLYVALESFLNELISAISTKTTDAFHNKYRAIDVLLLDDIQFLQGRPTTQEEFFFTFNALYESDKQIVISSDRRPDELSELDERFRSRFKQGRIAEIVAPDYETRAAILQKKAEAYNLPFDISVFTYIANNVSSNIRELEGALTNVVAFSRLYPSRPINMDLAQEALKDYIGNNTVSFISIPRITDIVCDWFHISGEDIRSKKKPKEIAYPRQIAMYLCRKLTEEPLTNIGNFFGRDHTTVIHACNKIQDDLDSSEGDNLRRSMEDLERRIKGE